MKLNEIKSGIMGLLNCEHCGGIVSDKATNCPHCGAPIDVLQENTETQPAGAAPQATASFGQEPSGEPQEDEGAAYEEGRTSFWLPWVIVVLVVLAAIAAFLIFNRNKAEGGSVIESMITDSTAVEEADTIVHITPEFIEAVQKYDYLGEFSEGFAVVSQNDKCGFINVRGEEVISCQYDEVSPFSEGKASVKRNGEWGYINTDGELVIPFFKADYANVFSEGLAYIVGAQTNDGMYRYRVIDTQGNTVFSGKTEWEFFDDGPYVGNCPSFRNGEIAIGNGLYDRTGRKISEYNGEARQNNEGNYKVFSVETPNEGIKLYGLKDSSGNIVIPAQYVDISPVSGSNANLDFHNGVMVVCLPPDNVSDYSGYDFEGFAGGGFFCNKWYYGYADMNGHDTFSEDFKERSSKAMKEAWQKFKEKKDEESANNQNYGEEGGNGYQSTSSQNEDEWRAMSRIGELNNEGLKLLDELSAMRNSGNTDPWRVIYIKKRCLSIKDEQISLCQQLGDYQTARQYEQQKERLVQSFRLMDP